MKTITFISLLYFISITALFAQDRKGPSPEMFEKIKSEKISFFTSRLDLKPAEAQAFWPVYNEFDKKKFELLRQIHDFERMSDEKFASLSDSELEKITNDYIETYEKQAQLIKEYNKQFLKILPKKKVLMMYRTENEFRSYLIKEYKKGQRRD